MSQKVDTSSYLEDSHLIFPFILLTSNSRVHWSRDPCRSYLPHLNPQHVAKLRTLLRGLASIMKGRVKRDEVGL